MQIVTGVEVINIYFFIKLAKIGSVQKDPGLHP